MLLILLIFGIWYMVIGAIFGIYVVTNTMQNLDEEFDKLNEEAKKALHYEPKYFRAFIFLYAGILWIFHIIKGAARAIVNSIKD